MVSPPKRNPCGFSDASDDPIIRLLTISEGTP